MAKRKPEPAAPPAHYPSDAADRIQLRLPGELRDLIHKVAKQNYRSANNEIVYRLIKSLEADGFRLPEAEEDAA
jgi:hypothetical protein